jgi:Flp pilus assembly protein TadB
MAKNPYNHDELRRQQQKGEQGLLASSGDSRSTLRVIAVPLVVLLVGVILLVLNVLGILGVLLIVGGAMGVVIAMTTSMLGR